MINGRTDFSMEGVASASQFSGLSGGLGVGVRKKPKTLENFSKDPSAYFNRLKLLRDQTLLNFDSRGGKNYSQIIEHFSNNYAQNGYFAVNGGNPAGGQIKALIDLPLSDVSQGYFNDSFIGKDILTPSPVIMRSGHIGTYGNEHNNPPDKDDIRAEGRANVKQMYPVSRDFLNYLVGTFAIKDSLSPDDYMNVIKPFDAEADSIMGLKAILMLICEIDIANVLTDTTNYPAGSVSTLTGNERFDEPSTSSIDKVAQSVRNSVLTECGQSPNTAVMDKTTFEVISRHPQARGTIFKDVSMNRTASEEEVRKLLQVDRLLIGKASRTNSNARGAQRSRVWGKDIWLGFVDPAKRKRQVTFGYYHHFQNADSFVISRQSVGNPMNKELFCYQSWQHHFVDFKCGGIIKNAIS